MSARPESKLDTDARRIAPGTERFCAVTGVVKPVADMIRFVLAPDGTAVPDLKRRLPGRGMWITGTREALARAIARKLFARSFKREVRISPNLVASTERLLEQAALDALAIARKAGKVAVGFAKVEAMLADGHVAALLHAAEAAPDGMRKLRPGGEVENLIVIRAFTSAQLDLALGRANVIHAAVLAGPESETFLARVARLERFRTSGPGGVVGHGKPSQGFRELGQ